jgi:hypothetical protein
VIDGLALLHSHGGRHCRAPWMVCYIYNNNPQQGIHLFLAPKQQVGSERRRESEMRLSFSQHQVRIHPFLTTELEFFHPHVALFPAVEMKFYAKANYETPSATDARKHIVNFMQRLRCILSGALRWEKGKVLTCVRVLFPLAENYARFFNTKVVLMYM